MQSYRALTRLPIQQATRTLIQTPPTRKMSLWPRSVTAAEPSFGSLFRLLDEFDNYRGGSLGTAALPKSFNPKFDIRENQTNYELHGELPGVDQNNVTIEFTDASTLTIRGHTEKSYEKGTPPRGFVEEPNRAGAIEGKTTPHKATVEDEQPDTAIQQTTQEQSVQKQTEGGGPSKVWVSERSVGDFSRSFSFPNRVDQDNVHASMKNGILSVVVPKAKKAEARKITISS